MTPPATKTALAATIHGHFFLLALGLSSLGVCWGISKRRPELEGIKTCAPSMVAVNSTPPWRVRAVAAHPLCTPGSGSFKLALVPCDVREIVRALLSMLH